MPLDMKPDLSMAPGHHHHGKEKGEGPMKLGSTRILNDGTKMPVLGFGTNVLKGASCVDAIKTAMETGYRLIDTAQSYEN